MRADVVRELAERVEARQREADGGRAADRRGAKTERQPIHGQGVGVH